MRRVTFARAVAASALRAACGGEAEEGAATDAGVADEVTVPATMPAEGDVATDGPVENEDFSEPALTPTPTPTPTSTPTSTGDPLPAATDTP